MLSKQNIYLVVFVLVMVLIGVSFTPTRAALTVGETYTVTVKQVNSDGTTTTVSSTTAIADADGKISFTLSNVPTSPTTNFIAFELADPTGTVVRQGFAPAPPAGNENLLGVNNVSTSQTKALLKCGELTGTDDPILVGFGLVLTRSPGITDDDIERIAMLGNSCIRGTDGFEDFLTDSGVTEAQLETFRNKLVYNATSGTKDLSDFTAKFKDAVDNDSDDEMAKAGGLMAEIFIDAGNAAGIDPTLILAAHDAAGGVSEQAGNLAIMLAMDTSVQKGIEQSMSSFFMRIAAMKMETEYSEALTTLGGSTDQVNTYLAAAQAMVSTFEGIETTFGEYFMDRDAFLAADNGYDDDDAVQAAINTQFNTGFSTFQAAIQSTAADITDMKANVVACPGIGVGDLPGDFGFMYDFSGTQVRWPIPQTVMVNWLATIVQAGGSLTYTRDTLAIPDNLDWIGSCSDASHGNQGDCEGDGDTWTSERNTFSGFDDGTFDAYRGLEEDVRIIEFARWESCDGGGRDQDKAARVLFQQRLEDAMDRIGGTVDGSTAISSAQKQAIIKLLQEPSMD